MVPSDPILAEWIAEIQTRAQRLDTAGPLVHVSNCATLDALTERILEDVQNAKNLLVMLPKYSGVEEW